MRRPALLLGREERGSSNRRKSRSAAARARRLFYVSLVVMILAALFGLGRVMLTARAAESSYQADRLACDIKAERLEGDLLEVDMSALTTPSRIEQIAGETMRMAEASEIDYLCLPKEPVRANSPLDADGETVADGSLASLFASVMQMTAGEAQVLLVGDVGLASSR